MFLKCRFDDDSNRYFRHVCDKPERTQFQYSIFRTVLRCFHPHSTLNCFSHLAESRFVQPPEKHIYETIWKLPSANSCVSPEGKPRSKPEDRNEEPEHAGTFQTSLILKSLNRVHYRNIC